MIIKFLPSDVCCCLYRRRNGWNFCSPLTSKTERSCWGPDIPLGSRRGHDMRSHFYFVYKYRFDKQIFLCRQGPLRGQTCRMGPLWCFFSRASSLSFCGFRHSEWMSAWMYAPTLCYAPTLLGSHVLHSLFVCFCWIHPKKFVEKGLSAVTEWTGADVLWPVCMKCWLCHTCLYVHVKSVLGRHTHKENCPQIWRKFHRWKDDHVP